MPAGIHPLWLIIVALITLALGRDYFPSEAPGLSDTGAYLLALASALALFAESLLHQLGHAVVARRHGVEIEELDLWLLGGVARMAGEPRAAGDELRFAPSSTTRSTSARRSSLSTSCPPSRSTAAGSSARCSGGALRIASRPRHWPRGAAGCSGLCSSHSASGPSCPQPIGGLWLALVGGFIVVAAAAEAQRATIERELAGRIVATVMTTPAVTLAADLTLREAVVVGFSRQLFSALPVVGPDDGRSAC